MEIQKDNDSHWLKLNLESEIPLFIYDIEVELIGHQINLELEKTE